MKWIYITNEPSVAAQAEAGGVHQVMIDLELEGKAERQADLDTYLTNHRVSDIPAVARALSSAELMVRINPLNDGTEDAVREARTAGAQRIMLPMFQTAQDVARLLDIVKDLPVTFLVETPAAIRNLPDYISMLRPHDMIHFGLNDLSIALGYSFVFEPLAHEIIDEPARICREAGVPFGIGGLARHGHSVLPAEIIVGEHVRLGSSWAILSRVFRASASLSTLRTELGKLLDEEQAYQARSADDLIANHRKLKALVMQIADKSRRAAYKADT